MADGLSNLKLEFLDTKGVKAVRDTVEGLWARLKIPYTIRFSSENWNRPKKEIDALMELLVNTILDETKTLMDNNIRLQAIGNLEDLPRNVFKTSIQQ